ncbi:MAG: precorrin-8X methylmutase [Fastidiosipilaceae bacterium]|jgi:precorrin-8X/cobalt-precorrin-8 methylmutase
MSIYQGEEQILENRDFQASKHGWEGLINYNPDEIERRSFEIITEELGDRTLDPLQEPVIKRVIHTSADFEYLDNLLFSQDVILTAHQAIRDGAHIVTDTRMAQAGVNKNRLASRGGSVHCFMSDPDVIAEAKARGCTRATICVERGFELQNKLGEKVIFAIGNAPTALIHIYNLIMEGKESPALIVAAPVGFVNVIEAKELIEKLPVPSIIAKGRKGGSNIAAAICNALIYEAVGRDQ